MKIRIRLALAQHENDQDTLITDKKVLYYITKYRKCYLLHG